MTELKPTDYGYLMQFKGREVAIDPNPCRRLLGPGPAGVRCKTCKRLEVRQYANTYYKCQLRNNTSGPATDHRVNWFACAKYERR